MISVYNLFLETRTPGDTIDISKRTLKNKPKGMSPKEWMKISKPVEFKDIKFYSDSWGKSAIDNKFYGWSHRAIASFAVGDKVGKDTCGNINPNTSWVIKTDKEAAMQAAAFSNDVS